MDNFVPLTVRTEWLTEDFLLNEKIAETIFTQLLSVNEIFQEKKKHVQNNIDEAVRTEEEIKIPTKLQWFLQKRSKTVDAIKNLPKGSFKTTIKKVIKKLRLR